MQECYSKRVPFNISAIYSLSRGRDIPINQIIKSYLNLSDYEERRCFEIDSGTTYETDNIKLLKDRRAFLGISQKEVAKIIGCHDSMLSYFENGKRNISDIRIFHRLSKLYRIPLYVLIRNELAISDDELARVIKLEESNEKVKSESTSNDSEGIKEFLNDELMGLFNKIQSLSKSDLQVLVFMMIVFNNSPISNCYSKMTDIPQVFDIASQIAKQLDDQPKMASIMEILNYTVGRG